MLEQVLHVRHRVEGGIQLLALSRVELNGPWFDLDIQPGRATKTLLKVYSFNMSSSRLVVRLPAVSVYPSLPAVHTRWTHDRCHSGAITTPSSFFGAYTASIMDPQTRRDSRAQA